MPSPNVSLRSLSEVERYVSRRMVSSMSCELFFLCCIVVSQVSSHTVPAMHCCLFSSTSCETNSCAAVKLHTSPNTELKGNPVTHLGGYNTKKKRAGPLEGVGVPNPWSVLLVDIWKKCVPQPKSWR